MRTVAFLDKPVRASHPWRNLIATGEPWPGHPVRSFDLLRRATGSSLRSHPLVPCPAIILLQYRKRTEGRIERAGEAFTALKGAPQILIGLSKLADKQASEVQQMVDMLGAKVFAKQCFESVFRFGLS
jgi:hypothetical protein